jgi:hypothetical protein
MDITSDEISSLEWTVDELIEGYNKLYEAACKAVWVLEHSELYSEEERRSVLTELSLSATPL